MKKKKVKDKWHNGILSVEFKSIKIGNLDEQ